ncbi:glycine zipper 2TM domain-containing protein [Novosphingobium sp. TCA1]|uniref:glycine zipper 2TM domain-containing protein n=1 Tax=Novosphingobium sp. TCA1 TaxID=2682474 RepID=UPI001056553B|nr:glycine zipper 2TM domain-containing protein [Novosphingobium sp. TCA1]GFE75593.1 hypothetical protein NTCA1_32420 [Novosphingobium sp. TCA1]
MNAFFKATALAAATASLATALPASAAVSFAPTHEFQAPGEQDYGHWRERYSREDRRRGYGNRDHYYRGDRATGTVLGAAAGALLGREVDRGGSRCR